MTRQTGMSRDFAQDRIVRKPMREDYSDFVVTRPDSIFSCVSSLGHGLLWFLFEPLDRLKILFTRTAVTLEQWPEWAKQRVVWRTRSLGEKHEDPPLVVAPHTNFDHGQIAIDCATGEPVVVSVAP